MQIQFYKNSPSGKQEFSRIIFPNKEHDTFTKLVPIFPKRKSKSSSFKLAFQKCIVKFISEITRTSTFLYFNFFFDRKIKFILQIIDV